MTVVDPSTSVEIWFHHEPIESRLGVVAFPSLLLVSESVVVPVETLALGSLVLL